jgi:hypothetical protein
LQSYVYPVMALIRQRSPKIRFRYVGVENPTDAFASGLRRPAQCIVICLGCMRVPSKWKQYEWLGHRGSLFACDNAVFWHGGSEPNVYPPFLGGILSQRELAARITQHLDDLVSLPVFARLNQIHELDSPFQSAQSAVLRAKRDAVFELRVRGVRIWEWSEPLRSRAAAGVATPQDTEVLRILDETYPQLIDLVQQRTVRFEVEFASTIQEHKK